MLSLFVTGCNLVDNKKDSINNKPEMNNKNIARATGIGGIFFKCDDPSKTRQWYNDNLGFVTNEYGSLMETRSGDKEICYLQWSPFNSKTTYFLPSEKDYMINYRVSQLDELFKLLENNGVTILDTIARYEYGNFLHILDNEGNKIELWEPVDTEFTKSYSGNTTIETTLNSIIFKAKEPQKLSAWYSKNLGFNLDGDHAVFEFRNSNNPENLQFLKWKPLPEASDEFEEGQQIILGYNMNKLDSVLSVLKKINTNILSVKEKNGLTQTATIMDIDNHQIILNNSK